MNHSDQIVPILTALLAAATLSACDFWVSDSGPLPCPDWEGTNRRNVFIVDDGSCQFQVLGSLPWEEPCHEGNFRSDSISTVHFCTIDDAYFALFASGKQKCPDGPDQDLAIDSIYLRYEGGVYTELVSDTIHSTECFFGRSGFYFYLNFSALLRDPLRDTIVWVHDGSVQLGVGQ